MIRYLLPRQLAKATAMPSGTETVGAFASAIAESSTGLRTSCAGLAGCRCPSACWDCCRPSSCCRSTTASLRVAAPPPSRPWWRACCSSRSEEHTSELQSPCNLVCRLLLEKKNTLSVFTWSYSSFYVAFIVQLLLLRVFGSNDHFDNLFFLLFIVLFSHTLYRYIAMRTIYL